MESNYILCYKINDENGGRNYIERFTNLQDMDARVNDLASNSKFNVICAGYVSTFFNYKPKEKVTRYERE